MRRYVLDYGEPVLEPDPKKWAAWFEQNNELRRVAWTEVGSVTTVSTVFLAMDHNYSGVGPPILWETMVRGRAAECMAEVQWRWTSRADAVLGHERAVALAREALTGELAPVDDRGEFWRKYEELNGRLPDLPDTAGARFAGLEVRDGEDEEE